MRKWLIVAVVVLAADSALARERVTGTCSNGAVSLVVGGVGRGNPKVLAVYGSCTVQVFISGTSTPATIYTNNASPGTPNATGTFTAPANGVFDFYVAGGRYDIRVSGGTPSPGITPPYTYGDVVVCDPYGPNSDAACSGGGGGSAFEAGADLSGTATSQTVVGLQTRPLLPTAPSANQVIGWSGTAWQPIQLGFSSISGTVADTQLPAAGVSTLGGVKQISCPLGDHVVSLGNSGVFVCSADAGSGFTAGGDLSGNSTSQTVIGIQSRSVLSTAPTSNQVLTWNGSAWEPATVSGGGGFTPGGDLSGTSSDQIVVGLQHRTLASTAPAANQFVGWNVGGSQWEPMQPSFANLSGSATLSQLPFGSANQFLRTNTAGTAVEQTTLTIGSAGTSPSWAFGTNSAVLNLPTATGSVSGILGATDWTKFNGSAQPGACTGTQFVTATTTSGVTCDTPPGGSGIPAGPTSSVQFNNGGAFGGNAYFTTDGAGNTTLVGTVNAVGFTGTGTGQSCIRLGSVSPGAGYVKVCAPVTSFATTYTPVLPTSDGTANQPIVTDGTSTWKFGTTIAVGAVKTATSSNTDLAGRITLSGGTGSYTFVGTHATAPFCVAMDSTDPTKLTGVTVNTTSISVTASGATDVVAYICIGGT